MQAVDCKINIPFKNTGFFTKTMVDYVLQDEKIRPFYNNFPNLEGFENQIDEKSNSQFFSEADRVKLVEVLKNQYKNLKTSKKTNQNIELLLNINTFTITTGHQLNLFTGPLYFLYKIISAINLCKELSSKFPSKNFVPVYWMATEDHDFEEINYFNFKGKKIKWSSSQSGAVGRFSTEGLQTVSKVFANNLGNSINASVLKNLFEEAYVKHNNLADATRYIANNLFENEGLVIIDADNADLKRKFIPYIKDELLNKTSYKEVISTNITFKKNYKVQVNPREINLFYLIDNQRERIVFEDGVYKVNATNISFSEAEILLELEKNPDRFSPNVIMRPLYQEVILPNLCYIGGGGELTYWLQLKAYFKRVAIPFPILLLRNSVQVISEKQAQKLEKLNISIEEIFLKNKDLLAKKIKENSEIDIDFSEQKNLLKKQFLKLQEIAKQTDKSFIGAVNAQEKKQINGLENLEKRLLKAEKRKQKELVDRITELQNQLFPNKSLEERQRNFSEFYLEFGGDFIEKLLDNLDPLTLKFSIIKF